jgi:pseudouridine synthase
MRINKYLAQKGYSTRRGADELISKKFVTINGKFATLGDKINATDVIEVRGNKKTKETYVYFAFNKPKGISTDKATPVITSNKVRGVFPVTPLETNTQGLVIMSNDRRLVDRLQNVKHAHKKEYVIRTLNELRPNFKEKMEQGVILGEGRNKVGPIDCKVNIQKENIFTLSTTDNGNNIRQMCALFGAEIDTMTRTQISNIALGNLQSNTTRPIVGDELSAFLKNVGL